MTDRYTSENTKPRGFLTPLRGPPLVPLVPPLPSIEQVLEYLAHRGEAPAEPGLGSIPAGGSPEPPGSPTDDLASAELPNLLVRVFLQSCKNTTVKGDGVNKSVTGRVIMTWFVDNADNVFSIGEHTAIPKPGEELNYSIVHGIYHAIVFDGCLSTEAFPIGVSAVIDISPGIQLDDKFSGFEPDTIRRGGVWTFDFTVHAKTEDGAHASDFRFHGMIDATCTNSKVSDPS